MLIEFVVVAFVATQAAFALCNCGLLGLFLRRPGDVVDERTLGRVLESANRAGSAPRGGARTDGGSRAAPTVHRAAPAPRREADDLLPKVRPADGPDCRLPDDHQRRIDVLVPCRPDGPSGLERTVESLAVQSYPASRLTVYVPFPAGEPPTDLERAAERRPEIEVVPLEVDADAFATERGDRDPLFANPGTTRETADLLTAAYDALSLPADGVVAVVEPGTWLPVDALELSVAGLEEYDVVQAKRTAYDVDAGIVPLLESMGSAIWSDLVTASRTGQPRLLSTGYVTEVRVLDELDAWRRESAVELPLGLALSRRGYALGVLDRYLRTDCTWRLDDWLRRKRAWCRSFYRQLLGRGWTGVDDARGWAGTVLLHAVALLAVVALPATVAVGALVAAGITALSVSMPLAVVVGVNAAVWTYLVARAYRAAWAAVPFRSRAHWLAYTLLANPVSQALYATLWAVPVVLGSVDAVRGD